MNAQLLERKKTVTYSMTYQLPKAVRTRAFATSFLNTLVSKVLRQLTNHFVMGCPVFRSNSYAFHEFQAAFFLNTLVSKVLQQLTNHFVMGCPVFRSNSYAFHEFQAAFFLNTLVSKVFRYWYIMLWRNTRDALRSGPKTALSWVRSRNMTCQLFETSALGLH